MLLHYRADKIVGDKHKELTKILMCIAVHNETAFFGKAAITWFQGIFILRGLYHSFPGHDKSEEIIMTPQGGGFIFHRASELHKKELVNFHLFNKLHIPDKILKVDHKAFPVLPPALLR